MKKRFLMGAALLAALLFLFSASFYMKQCEPDTSKQTLKETPISDHITEVETPRADRDESEVPAIENNAENSPVAGKPKGSPAAQGFTLIINGKAIPVAYGVEENTLKKSPGWLTSSAYPGEEGACIVYGHRNRTHLKALENVKIGDVISVKLSEGTKCSYTVFDIRIYENTKDFQIPATEGKSLVLATCYPFRYSGNAPGKCVVLAKLVE